jgi:hypothetical protein
MTIQMARVPEPTSKEYLAFKADFEKAEAAKKTREDEAVVRRVAGKQLRDREQGLRILNYEMGEIWRSPLPVLAKRIGTPSSPAAARESWMPLFWNYNLVDTDDPPPISQSGEQAQREFNTFVSETLPKRFGFSISIAGATRLQYLVQVAIRCSHQPLTQDYLKEAFDVLLNAECFAAGELVHDKSLIVTASASTEQPDPTLTDLERLDTSTAEGRRAAAYLADRLYSSEAVPLCKEWLASLAQNFGGFCPSTVDLDYATRWFAENNRSFLDKRSFDAFRLHMCRIGRWDVPRMMSTEEIRSRAVERLDMSNRDVAAIVRMGTRTAVLDLLSRSGTSLI